MPISYNIDAQRRLVRTQGFGEVTFAEVMAHFTQLKADPRRAAELQVLLDFSQCTSLPTADQLRGVSERIAGMRDTLRFKRCAAIAGSDAMFGMLRMFEVFAQDQFAQFQVFRTVSDAEAWLC